MSLSIPRMLSFLLGAALVSCCCLHVQAKLIAHTDFKDGGEVEGNLLGDVSGSGWAAEGWAVPNTDLAGSVVTVDWKHTVPNHGVITAKSAVQFEGPGLGAAVQRALAEEFSGEDVYISFLTQWESGVIDSNDFVIWYFNNNGGPNIGYKADQGPDGEDFVGRTRGNTNQYSPTQLEIGKLYHVVGHLSKSDPAGNYDTYSLWVNPDRNNSANPDSVSEGESNIAAFTNVGVRTHQINPNGDFPDVLQFGNLRIADSWADVFPDPVDPDNLPIPGDFNDDKNIDRADFDILAANMYGHLDGQVTREQGDFNENGRIDLTDFHLFVGAFNAPAEAAGVPEPSALLLMVVPFFALAHRARRSRRV